MPATMMRRIIYTRPDGGVSICCLAKEIIAAMSTGGYFGEMARGEFDAKVDEQVRSGRPEWLAVRFIEALAWGGLTTAEALGVVRDRDCAPYGTGCELWDVGDLPGDRWFRNAWRRSANGGPINIDMKAARKIQIGRIRKFAEAQKIDLRLSLWRERIRSAETPEHLKAVWPKVLHA